MTDELRENLVRGESWRRIFFIALFAVAYGLASGVVGVVMVVQAGWLVIAGEPNPRLGELGEGLGRFLGAVTRYVTQATEHRPYPFAPWPGDES